MARYYDGLREDSRRCSMSLCSNRSRLFGNRDPESGWVGYFSECNARWYASDFLLWAFGIGTDTAMIIRELLYICHKQFYSMKLL